MKYEMKDLTDPQIRAIIKNCLIDLGDIDELTTFEILFLKLFAKNPPDREFGIETYLYL